MIPACSVPIADFVLGEDHPVRGLAAQLGDLEPRPVGHHRARLRDGDRLPADTFGAPQTIWLGSPSPMSTRQTLSRSASGCCSALITRPTTNLLERADAVVFDPLDLGPGHREALGERGGVEMGRQYSYSQSTGTRIRGVSVGRAH